MLHFVIEDSLGASAEYTAFFGTEYNKCLAPLVVLTFVLLIMLYLNERIIRKTSIEEYETKSSVPLFNCRVCDGVFGIAILSAIFHCIKLVHHYLSFLLNFEAFLKIGVTLFCLLLLIMYIALEKKRVYATNKKLFYSIFVGTMLICDSISVFALFKYANPEILSRIIDDCRTLEAVNKLETLWNSKRYKNADELISSLNKARRDFLKAKNISCETIDANTLTVKFNIVAQPGDVNKVRADQRLNSWKYRRNYEVESPYKTGQNSKTFTRKKDKSAS
jgi:hypothetical protein